MERGQEASPAHPPTGLAPLQHKLLREEPRTNRLSPVGERALALAPEERNGSNRQPPGALAAPQVPEQVTAQGTERRWGPRARRSGCSSAHGGCPLRSQQLMSLKARQTVSDQPPGEPRVRQRHKRADPKWVKLSSEGREKTADGTPGSAVHRGSAHAARHRVRPDACGQLCTPGQATRRLCAQPARK